MTTETTGQLPPCPLPDCKGGEHHYHNRWYRHDEEDSSCKLSGAFYTSCYGPHQPQQQWQPIEPDRIKAGMRIRATSAIYDRTTTYIGVAHHTSHYSEWRTEAGLMLTGWFDPTTYEVDLDTLPADPDADLIKALREASWRIEHVGGRPDPLPGLPEARDLLNKLRELGWTVIRAEEAGEQA